MQNPQELRLRIKKHLEERRRKIELKTMERESSQTQEMKEKLSHNQKLFHYQTLENTTTDSYQGLLQNEHSDDRRMSLIQSMKLPKRQIKSEATLLYSSQSQARNHIEISDENHSEPNEAFAEQHRHHTSEQKLIEQIKSILKRESVVSPCSILRTGSQVKRIQNLSISSTLSTQGSIKESLPKIKPKKKVRFLDEVASNSKNTRKIAKYKHEKHHSTFVKMLAPLKKSLFCKNYDKNKNGIIDEHQNEKVKNIQLKDQNEQYQCKKPLRDQRSHQVDQMRTEVSQKQYLDRKIEQWYNGNYNQQLIKL